MMKALWFWLALAGVASAAASADQVFVRTPITRDTWIPEDTSAPQCNTGILCIGDPPAEEGYIVLGLELPPAPSCNGGHYQAADATLNLYSLGDGVETINVSVHRVRTDYFWNEDPFCPTRARQPEYRAAPLDVRSVDQSSAGWHSFDITCAVAGWYNDPQCVPNNGLLLRSTTRPSTGPIGCFASKDYQEDPSKQPYVVIEFDCKPEGQTPGWIRECYVDPDNPSELIDPTCCPMGRTVDGRCIADVEATSWGFIKSQYQ